MAQPLKDEVRTKIQNSAIKLFTDRGYNETSIKEIARDAGVSVGNVYRYFSNKEDLYNQVVQGVLDGIQNILQGILNEDSYHIGKNEKPDEGKMLGPMMLFIELYRQEKPVFTMILKGEKGRHFEQTIQLFIFMLRDYFYRFWGSEDDKEGMSFVELSAFAHAIIYAVIDLLNSVSDEELENKLQQFLLRMVKGFLYHGKSEVTKQ